MTQISTPPGRVLALMAHPDDAEILCGGTLALLAQRGWAVHIATMTAGDCGTSELEPDSIAAIRKGEAQKAASLIDATYHCLGRLDLLVFYDEAGLRDTTSLLRLVRPDMVITHSPKDYMIDHEETARLARTACFGAPARNAPAREGTTQPPLEGTPALFYADAVEGIDLLGTPIPASFGVDVTSTLETKLEMLACHASQREWLRRHHGIDEYLETTRRWSEKRGRELGCGHAEMFRQHLGHGYPTENRLKTALPNHVLSRD